MNTKRVAAAVLWTFTAWYAWNFVAAATGLPALFGPVAGIAVAAAVTIVPARRWASAAPAEMAKMPSAVPAKS